MVHGSSQLHISLLRLILKRGVEKCVTSKMSWWYRWWNVLWVKWKQWLAPTSRGPDAHVLSRAHLIVSKYTSAPPISSFFSTPLLASNNLHHPGWISVRDSIYSLPAIRARPHTLIQLYTYWSPASRPHRHPHPLSITHFLWQVNSANHFSVISAHAHVRALCTTTYCTT